MRPRLGQNLLKFTVILQLWFKDYLQYPEFVCKLTTHLAIFSAYINELGTNMCTKHTVFDIVYIILSTCPKLCIYNCCAFLNPHFYYCYFRVLCNFIASFIFTKPCFPRFGLSITVNGGQKLKYLQNAWEVQRKI